MDNIFLIFLFQTNKEILSDINEKNSYVFLQLFRSKYIAIIGVKNVHVDQNKTFNSGRLCRFR